MINNYLKKIRVYFTAFVAVWMIFIIFMTQQQVANEQIAAVNRQAKYLTYSYEYQDKDQEPNFARTLLSAFQKPERVAIADTLALGVPVFVYHGLVNDSDRFSTTPENFKDQMFALKKAGYETIKLEEFIEFAKGNIELPEKSFLLTFDDGRRDSYEQADPILKTLGWSAVMFVASGQSFTSDAENGYYLNQKQSRDMINSGRWEIQSHAVQSAGGFVSVNAALDRGNFLSNKIWLQGETRLETEEEYRARVTEELTLSKAVIEETLGNRVSAFAYPFSDYGNQTINAEGISEGAVRNAVSSNYDVAFRQTWEVDDYFTFNYMDEDLYRLRRIETPSSWTGEELLSFMNKVSPKDLPYEDDLKANRGWKTPWGQAVFRSEGGLVLLPNEEQSGASVFLDGTRAWRDYDYRVAAERTADGFLTLYARYQSNDNYASCTFGDDYARIDQRVEGTSSTLALTNNSAPTLLAEYGIEVRGNEVICYEGGGVVATSSGLSPKISTGGIGLRSWSEVLGMTPLVVTKIDVRGVVDTSVVLESLPIAGE